jgi:prepilin-type N-terminal cleavage/methylation domain-containing protein
MANGIEVFPGLIARRTAWLLLKHGGMVLNCDRRFVGRSGRHAFTLIEVLVAVGLLSLAAGSSIWALTQANNYASIARLQTGALTAAQSRIDYLLADAPFNPQNGELGTSNEWAVGNAVQTVTIYTEPAGSGGQTHTVTGQMQTTVAQIPDPVMSKAPGAQLNLYSATVVVTYTYRNRNYRVQLNAVRTSDV